MPATPQPVSYLRQNGVAVWGSQTPALPYFSTQPSSAVVQDGGGAVFSVVAENYVSLSWQRAESGGSNFLDIPGQTGLQYSLSGVDLGGDNGAQFRVKATNASGATYSNSATLTVTPIVVARVVLQAPTSWVIGTVASCTIENTGTVDQGWTLSISPSIPLSHSAGTALVGETDTVTFTPAALVAYELTLTNESGGQALGSPVTVTGVPAPVVPEIASPRNASTLLFQPIDNRYHTVVIPPPHPGANTFIYDRDADTNYSAFGPTWYEVSKFNNWEWANAGGDWIDSTLTPQGSSHWHTSASGNSITPGNNVWYATPITELTQYAQANNRWLALIGITGIGGGGPRTIAGRHTANPPRVEVTYTDATTATLACKTSALLAYPPATTPVTFGDASGNIALSNHRLAIEFERPTKPVASATLHYFVVQHFGGNPGMVFSLINPPTANATGPTGVAASAGLWDLSIESIPGVIGSQRLVDTATESDFISTYSPNAYNTEWSPEFWGGAVNTAKLPYSSYHPISGRPRWVNAKDYDGLYFVKSDYTGEGFVPLRPGLGALKTTIPGNPAVDAADGYIGSNNGSTGCTARLFGIPPNQMGMLRHIRMRWYVRVHLPRPLVDNDRRVYYESPTVGNFSVLAGKSGFVPTHDCAQGGVSRSSGSGWGWQMRHTWKLALPGTSGPDAGKWSPAMHIKADYDFKSVDGYNYASNGYKESFGKIGGYGGAMNFDEWILFEADIKLNTVTTSGTGFIPDGHVRIWINDRLVMDDNDMAFVSLPLNPGVGAAVITAGGANVGNGGCVSNAVLSGGTDTSYKCFPETLTLTFTSPTAYNIVGSFRGSYGVGTVGTMYATNRHRFTVTAGSTPFQAGDVFTIVYPPRYTDMPNLGLTTPMRELGIRELWLNHFHGGRNEMGLDLTWFYTGLVWADGEQVPHIGPMALD